MIRFVNASAPAGHAERFESPRANESDETLEAAVAAFAGDEDVIEAAAAGLHSFLDRVQAVENFHWTSLVGVCARRTAWRWLVD
jgi:hypothetical protein